MRHFVKYVLSSCRWVNESSRIIENTVRHVNIPALVDLILSRGADGNYHFGNLDRIKCRFSKATEVDHGYQNCKYQENKQTRQDDDDPQERVAGLAGEENRTLSCVFCLVVVQELNCYAAVQ